MAHSKWTLEKEYTDIKSLDFFGKIEGPLSREVGGQSFPIMPGKLGLHGAP